MPPGRGVMRSQAAWSCCILLLSATARAAAPGPKVLVSASTAWTRSCCRSTATQGLMPNFDRFLAGGGQLPALRHLHPAPVAGGLVQLHHRARTRAATASSTSSTAIRETLLPYLSTSEAQGPTRFWKLGSWKIPRGGGEVEQPAPGHGLLGAAGREAGVDVTVFKVPANFPPVECEARSLSGMGTPDILGTYGIFTLRHRRSPGRARPRRGPRDPGARRTDGRFTAALPGPLNVYREGDPADRGAAGDRRVDRDNRAGLAATCRRRDDPAAGGRVERLGRPVSSRWCRCSRACAASAASTSWRRRPTCAST